MITKLLGVVSFIGERFLVLDVGGVGYKIFASPDTIHEVSSSKNETVALWTHLAVRENALDLYGFTARAELEFFELLLSVSGIGPKTALSIMSVAGIETLRKAVSAGDTTHLIKVSGIGSKNAHKIVIELKNKLGALGNSGDNISLKEDSEAIDALVSLGYSSKQARDALRDVSDKIIGTREKIKAALKILGS